MKTRCLLLLLLAGCQPQPQEAAPPPPLGIVWIVSPTPEPDAPTPAPELPSEPPAYEPDLGWAVRYQPTSWTQEIAVTDGRDRITPVPISRLEGKWQASGGLLGIKGWVSEKFKYVPSGGYHWVGDIAVLNGFNSYQNNRGIKRSYPDGTVFHDVLRNDAGVVFEHRVRSKAGGMWRSEVVHRDAAARPAGYTGLKVSCASCHSMAGTGTYASGLVPGGDTILSAPLDWSVAGFR